MNYLDEANINESGETLFSTILRIPQDSRKFKARLGNRELINGKIDRSLPDVLGFKSAIENTSHLLRFRIVDVRANRRYVLLGLAEADAPQGPLIRSPACGTTAMPRPTRAQNRLIWRELG
ncbi:MAG: hypothetical protein ACKOZW_07875, partial [Cyanobium sp.]